MLRSILKPALAGLLTAAAMLALWTSLRADHDRRIAEVAEAVSYATRSDLARELMLQFRTFRNLRDFWSDFARLPSDQWDADARIEMFQFVGVDAIAWSERDGPRYFTDVAELALNHEPTDEEWALISQSLDEARSVQTATIVGPVEDSEGHAILRLYLPVTGNDRNGVLIAIIDAYEQMDALLVDQAPGYDLRVSCCGDVELYSRGAFDAIVPDSWRREGLIEPLDSFLLRVRHVPTREHASSLDSGALDWMLAVSILMALSVALVVYHSQRAREQARSAQMAEREAHTLNRELEARVELRTRDLNDALTDLNMINLSVSHDLRSPLNTVSLLVTELRERAGNTANGQQTIDRLERSVHRMTGIVERLLRFAQVSSLEVEFREVDIDAIARELVEGYTAADGIRFDVGNLPPVFADRTMVYIVLSNLIDNAVRYGCRADDPRVEIGCEASANGEQVYFVRDNGPGFDDARKAELFQPKQRARPADDHNGENGAGLGLGLAIAARAVDRHGGRIWADSRPGHGATFRFTLPTRPGDVPA